MFNSWKIFTTSVLLLGTLSGLRAFEIDQNYKEITVQTGEETTLTCSTDHEIKGCSFDSPHGTTYVLFKGANYENNRIVEAGKTPEECALTVSSIIDNDSGVWTCNLAVVLEGENGGTTVGGKAQVDVTVAVAPEEIQLLVSDAPYYLPDLEMSLNSEPFYKDVKCMAVKTRVAPTFIWKIDDQVLSAETEDSEEVNGRYTNYAQRMRYYPNAKHNGMKLTCEVEHEAYTGVRIENGDNKKSLNVKVLYKPEGDDKVREFPFKKEGQSKTITMVFSAYPEPTEVYWNLSGIAEPLEMGAVSEDNKYRSSQLTPRNTAGEYAITLSIDKLTMEDAKNVNSLVIKNSEGTTDLKFKLHFGEETSKDTKMGSGPVVAVIIMVIVILVLIAFAMLIRSKGLFCFAAKTKKADDDTERAVEKEGSDTESAENHDPKNASTNSSKKNSSVSSKASNFLAAIKKSVSAKSSAKPDMKDVDEKKDLEKGDDVTYADLDQSAMSQGQRNTSTTKETEYAEIQHNRKD